MENSQHKQTSQKKEEKQHLPLKLLVKMLILSPKAKLVYESLGEFDYHKYPLSEEQEAELKKLPEAGPYLIV